MKKQIGQIGEDFVANFLKAKGYEMVESNFWCRFGEIDLICWDGEELVFVEVKARRGMFFGKGEEAINFYKKFHLWRSAEFYLQEKNFHLKSWRIDLISVKLDKRNGLEKLNHIKNIFNG